MHTTKKPKKQPPAKILEFTNKSSNQKIYDSAKYLPDPLSFNPPILSLGDIKPDKAVRVCQLLEALQEAMHDIRDFE